MKLYETERLIVRRWEARDAADLYEYASDPEVAKFLFAPYTNIPQAHERIESIIKTYENAENIMKTGEKIDYAIELKSESKVIGCISYAKYTEKAGGIVELGYMLNKKYQGSGYMNEAVLGIFQFIKSNNIGMRIEAIHDISNPSSGNVMKRVGMTFEGILRKRVINKSTGQREDAAIYSILVEEI